jgi:hypothetical protein
MGERDGAQQEGRAVEGLVDSENSDCFRGSLCCRVECRPSKLACAPIAQYVRVPAADSAARRSERPCRLERVGRSVRL